MEWHVIGWSVGVWVVIPTYTANEANLESINNQLTWTKLFKSPPKEGLRSSNFNYHNYSLKTCHLR